MNIYRSEFISDNVRLELLCAGYATVGTEWCGMERNAPFSFLYYITEGEAWITTEKEKILLMSGNWYLLPAGCKFSYKCSKSMTQIYFHIKLCGEDKLDMLSACQEPVRMERNECFSNVIEYIKNGEPTEGLGVYGMVYSVLFEMLTKNQIRIENVKLSPCVRLAVEYMNNNLSASLSTVEIAQKAFVSKSTLCKYFAQEIQMSVQEYLYDLIFYKACQMLIANRMSIGRISLELGFCDQLYFSRKFRERYGVSPREYRNRFI